MKKVSLGSERSSKLKGNSLELRCLSRKKPRKQTQAKGHPLVRMRLHIILSAKVPHHIAKAMMSPMSSRLWSHCSHREACLYRFQDQKVESGRNKEENLAQRQLIVPEERRKVKVQI